ncbi:unnamed protein product, partial [Ixodes pacificus]
GRSLLGTDAVYDLRLILSGAPLKCFHVNSADSCAAIPGHVTSAGVPQPPCTVEPSPPPHPSSAPCKHPPPLSTVSGTQPSTSSEYYSSRGVVGDQTSRDPSTSEPSLQPSSVSDASKLPSGFEEFEDLFSPELGLVKNQTHTITVRHHVPP